MRNFSCAMGCRLLTITVFLIAAVQLVSAQTDREARKAFERAERHYKKGEFEAAIEGFSEVIDLSSQKGQPFSGATRLTPGEPDIARIETISPLLAASYSNRC